MSLFTRSLWPKSERRPYLRLLLALLISPVVIAGLLTLSAFLIAGMTEQTKEGTMETTRQAALTLSAVVGLFTVSFGLIGVTMLWALAQRGPLAWALAGALLGALGGVVFTMTSMGRIEGPVLIAFFMCGWAMFLMIRWIAGIRDA